MWPFQKVRSFAKFWLQDRKWQKLLSLFSKDKIAIFYFLGSLSLSLSLFVFNVPITINIIIINIKVLSYRKPFSPFLQCSTLSRFNFSPSYDHILIARKITPLWFCPPQTSTPQLQKAQAPKSLSIFAHIFQRTKVFAFYRAHQRSFSSLWRHVISWALKPEPMITGLYREQWRHQRSRKPRYTNLWCHLGILRKQNNVGVAVKNFRKIIRK